MQQQMAQRQAQEEQKSAMREQKQAMMVQLLSDEARIRLGNIAAVKPDKAERLENIILQNAQSGRFQGKVTEAQLIDLLEQVSGAEAATSSTVERKAHRFDEEEELDLDNLDL